MPMLRILYAPAHDPGRITRDWPEVSAEYLTDVLFHGLRQLPGVEVVDNPRLWHMYQDADKSRLSRLHGGGYTIHGLLPEIPVDRTRIGEKIRDRYFDFVIIPVHTTKNGTDHNTSRQILHHVQGFTAWYGPEKLIFVDGLDGQYYHSQVVPYVTYFKREISPEMDGAFRPICYGVPEEKILQEVPQKDKLLSSVIPGYAKTYIRFNEQAYYRELERSYLMLSHRRGGWDCLRHYEIMARGCAPVFLAMDRCPKSTMFRYPKALSMELNKELGLITDYTGVHHTLERSKYRFDNLVEDRVLKRYCEQFLQYVRKHLTTTEIAKYLLEEIL